MPFLCKLKNSLSVFVGTARQGSRSGFCPFQRVGIASAWLARRMKFGSWRRSDPMIPTRSRAGYDTIVLPVLKRKMMSYQIFTHPKGILGPIARSKHFFGSVFRFLAIATISAYQKYLSPRKGYRCAHRALYDGDPCSEYVKKAIASQSLAEAIQSSRRRFHACGEANRILKSEGMRPRNPLAPSACLGSDSCDDLQCGCLKLDFCTCND